MNATFKKLNFKDQAAIVVINAPVSFTKDMQEMSIGTRVNTTLPAKGEIFFVLAFVTKQQEVDTLTKKVVPRLSGDALLWFAYPKGTSKKYKCEFNRDSGWTALGKNNFEPVRMVAIDEDWSALRFRHVDHIKVMTRSRTISDAGSKKALAPKKAPAKKFSQKTVKTRSKR